MHKIFSGIKQASLALGIPKEVLSRAKRHKASPRGRYGFDISGRVHWDNPNTDGLTLEQWITNNYSELRLPAPESTEYWLLCRDKNKCLLSELLLKQTQDKIIDKQSAIAGLENIRSNLNELFERKIQSDLIDKWNLPEDRIQDLNKFRGDLDNVWNTQIAMLIKH
ncbi:MAG: hypothetical protein WCT12_09535 [Verrucomicrobiota bacterium]